MRTLSPSPNVFGKLSPPTKPVRITQRGVSLIELMVAMVIGLFLVGAVAVLYVNTSAGSRTSAIESQLNEDASVAMELLQQQIRLAGFSDTDTDGNRLFFGRPVFGCSADFSDKTAAFGSLACGSSGSASLAVRYHATTLNSQPNTSNQPTNCAFEGITGWTPGAAEGAATALTLADNRYYIANDANNNNTPTLHCVGRTGAGFGIATALIPGIQDMQLTFGVTAAPVLDQPLPHQVNAYLSAAQVNGLANGWNRVAAIRICLLARSTQQVPLGTASGTGNYKDCAGTSVTSNDRYLRRAYVSTIYLRNMRPAMPDPYTLDGGTVVDPWAYMTEE